MKVAAGWDHRGRQFHRRLERVLEKLGHELLDMGCDSDDPSDYPDSAFRVANAVARGECARGVLICGTGMGMSIAANKVDGVRAALVYDEETARVSRTHNNANVLCLGESTADSPLFEPIIGLWFNSTFEGGRHKRRVDKITRYESERNHKAGTDQPRAPCDCSQSAR